MRAFKLCGGYVTLVDEEDIPKLSKYNWYLDEQNKGRGTGYYRVRTKIGSWVSMPRYLLGITDPKIQVDHINGNPLDNRRKNLRIATHGQNMHNSGKQKSINGKPCTSKYKGVTLFRSRPHKGKYGTYEYWRAQICVDGEMIYLGQHKTEEDAARVYNTEAIKHFGDFARLNEIAS